MKGKRHATEQKIRILREADGGKNIVEVCKVGLPRFLGHEESRYWVRC